MLSKLPKNLVVKNLKFPTVGNLFNQLLILGVDKADEAHAIYMNGKLKRAAF